MSSALPPVVTETLKRLLVATVAGTATSGALLASAKRQGAPKRRKKGEPKPAAPTPAEHAQREIALLDDKGISWADVGNNLASTAKRAQGFAAGLFQRRAKPTVAASDAPDAHVIEPDFVDGKPQKHARAAKHAAPRPGGKRRRKKRRPQASLWDSAKESMRQTVKEAVAEEVKDTPVGKAGEVASQAMQALKKAGDAVKDGASVLADKAKEISTDKRTDDAKHALTAAAKAVSQGVVQAVSDVGALAQDVANKASEPSATNDSAETTPAASAGLVEQVDALSTWLKGPGGGPVRPRLSTRPPSAADEIVEAKDPDDT